jgi:hypothetical protein
MGYRHQRGEDVHYLKAAQGSCYQDSVALETELVSVSQANLTELTS